MTFEEFVEELDTLTQELSKDDKDVLRQFLGHKSVLHALALVMLQRSQVASELIGRNFENMTSDQAHAIAAKTQGIAVGIDRAVGLLFELAESEEREENPDGRE